MITQQTLDFLKHYGVKGQKWGVTTRSKRSSSGAPSERVVKAKAKALSNDELKKSIERMRLEQQYSELANPGAKAGKKYAVDVLKQSGNKLIGVVVTAAATVAVSAALGKHIANAEARKAGLVEDAKLESQARREAAKHASS